MPGSRILYTPREYSPKRRKPPLPYFKIVLAALVFILILAGSVYGLRYRGWQIQEIKISGLKTLNEDALRQKILESLSGKFLFFIPRGSFFWASAGGIEKKLEADFPQIESVWVSKKFPSVLEVKVQERSIWGILCNDLKNATSTPDFTINCVYLDKNGFAYDSAPLTSGSLFLRIKSDRKDLTAPAQIFDKSFMDKLEILRDEVWKASGDKVLSYEVKAGVPEEINLLTDAGYKIILNKDDDFSSVFRVLKTLLAKEIKNSRPKLDYIDLRFGNKVFYKFK